MILLWLLLAQLAPGSTLFSSCTPRFRGRLCLACTKTQMESAIKPCLPAYNYHVEGNTVIFNQSRQGEYGLGNHLGQYFQARGVALLAGMDFQSQGHFEFMDIRLPSWMPAVRASRRYARVPELDHYCKKCPSNTDYMFQRWFHSCMAAWMVINITEELIAAVTLVTPPFTPYDIVIQLRCGDSHKHPKYGMLPWRYYREALAPHLTEEGTVVAILPDPDVPREPFCMGLLTAIKVSLEFVFKAQVEILKAGSLVQDMALMMNAKVFVSHVSSLGFWVAMGCRGKSYLPVHEILVGGQKPCVRNVSWIRSPVIGCSPYYAGERSRPNFVHTWFTDVPALQTVIRDAIAYQ